MTEAAKTAEHYAKLVEEMADLPVWRKIRVARIAFGAAAKTIRRGRHLTDAEKLTNLFRALHEDGEAEDPTCTDCGGTGETYQTERLCVCRPPIMTEAREKVAAFMTRNSFATGHGDTLDDLLGELDAQVRERALLIESLTKALEKAEEWLSGWASAEPQLATIRTALASAQRAKEQL